METVIMAAGASSPVSTRSKTNVRDERIFVEVSPQLSIGDVELPSRAEKGRERDAPPGRAGGASFVLAHLSDPHLSSLTGVRFSALLNKRLLGYLSWRHHRRRIHCPQILEALLCDLADAAPSHVVVTGDLTCLGLPDEFHQTALWLRRLGPPESVTVVPGNHDAYVAEDREETCGAWAPYLAGDEGAFAGVYPSVRVRGPAALIGLSSARPSAPFLAVGSLGRSQLARFEKVLEETGRRGLLRIVLLHHPPVPGTVPWRKRLTDARRFADVVRRQGAELILHGHAHVCVARRLVAGTRNIPVFGVPSASGSDSNSGRAARYHLCRFEHRVGGWALMVTARAYSPVEKRFVIVQEMELLLPRFIP
jgi:3',5'-cyclic AMP phosphodiesterase CpdA